MSSPPRARAIALRVESRYLPGRGRTLARVPGPRASFSDGLARHCSSPDPAFRGARARGVRRGVRRGGRTLLVALRVQRGDARCVDRGTGGRVRHCPRRLGDRRDRPSPFAVIAPVRGPRGTWSARRACGCSRPWARLRRVSDRRNSAERMGPDQLPPGTSPASGFSPGVSATSPTHTTSGSTSTRQTERSNSHSSSASHVMRTSSVLSSSSRQSLRLLAFSPSREGSGCDGRKLPSEHSLFFRCP